MTDPDPTDVARRPDIEAWLNERRVEWTFDGALAVDRIDKAKSLANQARLEPLDGEEVDRYAADLARGDLFPPVVALDPGRRRKLVLLGGNHRYHAHLQAKRATVAAYVVQCEPEMAPRLTYEDNRRHGLPPTEAERIAQAVHLIDNGWTQEDAAACVGVPASRISIERSLVRAARRADSLEVPKAFHALGKAVRYELGQIHADPVFAEAARLAVDARLTTSETKVLRRRIDDARSEKEALNYIGAETEELRARIQQGAGGKAKVARTARARLQSALDVVRFLDPAEVKATTPNADVAKTVKDQILAAAAVLQQIQKAL